MGLGDGHRPVAPGSSLRPFLWPESPAVPFPQEALRAGLEPPVLPSQCCPGDSEVSPHSGQDSLLMLRSPPPTSHCITSAPSVPRGSTLATQQHPALFALEVTCPVPCKPHLLSCRQGTGRKHTHFPKVETKPLCRCQNAGHWAPSPCSSRPCHLPLLPGRQSPAQVHCGQQGTWEQPALGRKDHPCTCVCVCT